MASSTTNTTRRAPTGRLRFEDLINNDWVMTLHWDVNLENLRKLQVASLKKTDVPAATALKAVHKLKAKSAKGKAKAKSKSKAKTKSKGKTKGKPKAEGKGGSSNSSSRGVPSSSSSTGRYLNWELHDMVMGTVTGTQANLIDEIADGMHQILAAATPSKRPEAIIEIIEQMMIPAPDLGLTARDSVLALVRAFTLPMRTTTAAATTPVMASDDAGDEKETEEDGGDIEASEIQEGDDGADLPPYHPPPHSPCAF